MLNPNPSGLTLQHQPLPRGPTPWRRTRPHPRTWASPARRDSSKPVLKNSWKSFNFVSSSQSWPDLQGPILWNFYEWLFQVKKINPMKHFFFEELAGITLIIRRRRKRFLVSDHSRCDDLVKFDAPTKLARFRYLSVTASKVNSRKLYRIGCWHWL